MCFHSRTHAAQFVVQRIHLAPHTLSCVPAAPFGERSQRRALTTQEHARRLHVFFIVVCQRPALVRDVTHGVEQLRRERVTVLVEVRRGLVVQGRGEQWGVVRRVWRGFGRVWWVLHVACLRLRLLFGTFARPLPLFAFASFALLLLLGECFGSERFPLGGVRAPEEHVLTCAGIVCVFDIDAGHSFLAGSSVVGFWACLWKKE